MANPLGTWTMFKRETKRFMKVYTQTILAPVVNNLLYFAIFGISLHRAIPEIQGVSYLQFLVPGLITLGMVNNAYQNPSSSIIIMKYQGLVRDLMTVPIGRGEIMLAFVSSAVLRALIVGAMTFITALFFVDFSYTSIGIILITLLLVSLFFAFVGLFVGIWADEFDRAAFIQNFVLMPMIFLGGVFYPISTLPEIAQTVSSINPIVHMINLLRYGFTGIVEFPIIQSLAITSGVTFAMGVVTYMVLRSGWKLQN